MTHNWQLFVDTILKSTLIRGLGTIVHELGHYATTIVSGGELVGIVYDPILGMGLRLRAPESAAPMIRLSGGLAEAAFYALLSMADLKLLAPASMCLVYAYNEMSQNNDAMILFSILTTLSLGAAQIQNIPEGELF